MRTIQIEKLAHFSGDIAGPKIEMEQTQSDFTTAWFILNICVFHHSASNTPAIASIIMRVLSIICVV